MTSGVVPARRQLSPARLWTLLPAVVMILADAVITLWFQPASYWSGVFADRDETSPLGAVALSLHPAAFALVILVYLAVVVALVLRLGQPWNRALALSVVVGHTAGIYGWFVSRNYWYAIPTFLLVGIMTVLSWQRAEGNRSP